VLLQHGLLRAPETGALFITVGLMGFYIFERSLSFFCVCEKVPFFGEILFYIQSIQIVVVVDFLNYV
jgi:hypothetical protein